MEGASRCSITALPLKKLALLFITICQLSQVLTETENVPCTLSTGSSRESFTANELLPTGSVIGILNIIGDPSENGTIDLRLSQDDSAVYIAPGTKNLTLLRPLDKEGVDGPAEINLQIYCRRRGSTELKFPIPLRVYVSDANDNAPQFVDFPQWLEISEMTQPGSVVTTRPIRAVDRDQTGPFSTVQYSIEPGPFADYFTFTNALEGNLVLKAPLDYEKLPFFNLTIKAQDLGSPAMSSLASIRVKVLDADDLNPKFQDERYTVELPDTDIKMGTVLEVKPYPIKAEDQDIGINSSIRYSFKSDKVDGKYFGIDNVTGAVYLKAPFPDDLILPLTLVIKAEQVDNPARTALTTLTLSHRHTFLTGLHFLQTDYVASVPENLPLNQTVVVVQTNRPNERKIRYTLLGDLNGQFSITNRGEVILRRPFDYDSVQHYYLRINATDGKLSDVARVNISVQDVNKHDPEFGSRLYNFIVMDGMLQPGTVLGKIDAWDRDSGDNITFSLMGDSASSFYIDSSGEVQVTNISFLNGSVTHLVAIATDTGHPPRQSSVPIIITLTEEPRVNIARTFSADSSFLLMIVFGAMLGVLILIILVLALYIAKRKHPIDQMNHLHPSTQSLSKVASYVTGDIPHHKLPRDSPNSDSRGKIGVENPIFNNDSEMNGNNQSTLHGDSPNSFHTTLSLSKSNTSSLQPNGRLSKPSLPRVNGHIGPNPLINGSPTGKWMNGSIPRRVKKLSWEDEHPTTELDPDVSVTPFPKSVKQKDHQPELTVYF